MFSLSYYGAKGIFLCGFLKIFGSTQIIFCHSVSGELCIYKSLAFVSLIVELSYTRKIYQEKLMARGVNFPIFFQQSNIESRE